MTLALIAVIVESAAELLEPWPLKIILDYVLQSKPLHGPIVTVVHWFGGDKQSLIEFSVAFVAVIAVAGAASSYLENWLTTKVGQRIMHDLRRTVYHHIQRLSLAEHDEKRTGDLVGRVTDDIESVQDFVSSALLGIVTDAATLIGMVAFMFYLKWRFTLISLSVVPMLFAVVYLFTRHIKKATREVRKKESELVSTVQEVFSSIRVVKAFAREDYEQRRFERQSLDNVETALRAQSLKMKMSPVVEVITAVGTCLMLGFGTRLVLQGQLTAGELFLFLFYLGKMYKPMRDLSKMTNTVSKASVGFERIREILETESKVRDIPRARRAPAFKGKIEFENVSFGYTPEELTIKDIRFTVEPGQIVALAGPTGGGKTTIVNLVARFYDPVSGRIKIDGMDIREFKIRSLRAQISFVLQDTLLFRAPVWQNIAYGRPEASRKEIMEAAELANADEFIREMPEGYNTMIGERGVTLSGGQRQRIAIARALIRNSPILILDEPTSGLDAQAEQTVFAALDRLMKNKTSLVIAHHLATILKADEILVIKDNTLAERGTHKELIAAGGFYAELYNIQTPALEHR
jgi:subfamily B ATP-binding cassette protein MsbA